MGRKVHGNIATKHFNTWLMKRRELMTFPEFESKCQQWFDKNERRFLLSDLRVWRTVPGSCTDNDVWYCVVNIRHGVNMILLYDHSGELDAPFEVWCDWAGGSVNITSTSKDGYTTSLGEYYSMAEAMIDMTEEPSPFRISILHDSCGIGKVLNAEEKELNLTDAIDLDFLSFLECLQRLENWRKDPLCKYNGRQMTIYRRNSYPNIILYTTQL